MCFLFDCKISKKNQIPLLSIINEKKRLFLFKEIIYLCGCECLNGTYLVVLGALCLTLRLLQWGKFFSLDEPTITSLSCL